jgi:hypothetical protein
MKATLLLLLLLLSGGCAISTPTGRRYAVELLPMSLHYSVSLPGGTEPSQAKP